MARYKTIYLLLLTYIVYVSAKEAEDRTISLKPPDKLVLEKSSPYIKPEPSFLSKIKNWFFPSSDLVPEEGHHGGPQYLPPHHQSRPGGGPQYLPPHHQSGPTGGPQYLPPNHQRGPEVGPQYLPPRQNEPGCNPCNKSPWIPVASNVGHNTLINFVPPSSQYGPPQTGAYGPPPAPHYGAPPTQQYGPPPAPQYGAPPKQQYGPPTQQHGTNLIGGFQPSNQYGAPPPTHHAPPSLQYGSPPANQYGAPPPTQHTPPSPQYGAPPSQFRPPVSHSRPAFRPRPDKFLHIENLRPPPPVTHLRPVTQNYAPIGMSPPPLTGSYHSLATPPSTYNLPPPPPSPSDSYGAPITGPNAQWQIQQEYLPPLEQLPLGSIPIPLPNLSEQPLAPIRNYQNFHGSDSVPQQGSNFEVHSSQNVQVLPSVKVADFLASIDHPINVIQSPLVEVNVKNTESIEGNRDVRPGGFYEDAAKLSENPIIVEDTHTAASAINVTFQDSNSHQIPNLKPEIQAFRAEGHEEINSNFIKEILAQEASKNTTFTPPPLDYSKWEPTYTVSSSMVPPPIGPTTWLQPVSSTTKKPNQIQIIVPYINNRTPVPFNDNVGRMIPSKPYTTLLPVYSPPATTEEVWSKFLEDFKTAESKKVAATAFTPPTSTQVYNIRDLLKDTKEFYPSDKLPFDVISLQNNIDDWTEQAFSKSKHRDSKSTNKFQPAKKIPDEFFTTPEAITVNFDHEQAASGKKETKLEDDIETNLILSETTEAPTTVKPVWDVARVTVSSLTKEKVYIVTPQSIHQTSTPKTAWSHPPKIHLNQSVSPTPKFLVRVDPEDENSRDKLKGNVGPLTVVFSEWPHLINNLQTTKRPPTADHPLLGLMDLSKYTPPPNATVETISGHSRVVTVVTPSTVHETTRSIK